MDANSKWFELVDKIDPWFQRKDDMHVVVSFNGWKPAAYFEACDILTKAGAFQLDYVYDKLCGKTFVTFREPKQALECRK